MDVPSLPVFRHSFTDCPCGHSSHIGRWVSLADKPATTVVECEACEADAKVFEAPRVGVPRETIVLAIVTGDTTQQHALNVGSKVSYDRRTMEIVDLEQVMLLGGRLATEYVRVLMVEVAQ